MHIVTVSTRPIPSSHYGEQSERDVCYSVQHGLEAEFGTDSRSFEAWTEEAGPTSTSSGAVWVAVQFESSLDIRTLDARLSEFRAGGKNEAGEWELALESYDIN